jgi:hypothetical protein
VPRNVSKGRNELVKVGINSRTTYEFHLGLWLTPVCHALDDLLVRLTDERVEEVVQRIFADCLELVRVLVVTRLGAVVDMALS